MQNDKLKVILDPTHGGIDFGISNNGIYEKDLVLELSQYIKNRLKDLDIETTITRDKDITLSPDDRINFIKKTFGDNNNVLVISNGLNTIYENGADIIYPERLPNLEIVNDIKEELEKTGLNPVNTYSRTNIEGNIDESLLQQSLNNAIVIIIDYGEILNQNTTGKINENLYKYGEAIVKAIANNQNINYISKDINTNTYIVSKGESLYSIANKFNITVDELKRLNNLSSTKLNIGQILKLPETININNINRNINNTYIVKKGDTLYSIAKKFNTTVKQLINLNNLNSNMITINQKLIIS